jgi:uncharacterized 2Fe-2S/4Fe-4S cluster protein (DUF4445 family)
MQQRRRIRVARVTFLPENISVEVRPESTILDAAREAGIALEAPCNGTGKCGKCRVVLLGQNAAGGEKDGNTVLACQTQVGEGRAVELTGEWGKESIRVLEAGASAAGEIDPFVTKKLFTDGRETAVLGGGRVLAREEGDTTGFLYGVVVDIGTTTLVATLVDLKTGKEVVSTSALNPQSLHAHDVLSRIKLASDSAGLALLYGLFLSETDRMIGELTDRSGVERSHIYEVVYSGNTTMLHLATSTDPSPLGRYPYTPVLRGGDYLPVPQGGLHVADGAGLYLPPVISGFVGADIVSGVLATRLHERKGTTLFIDIGTNGEMVIAGGGRLVASSTAAGPAFEGMNITFGMRAGDGAIESFEAKEGGLVVGTIGQAAPKGICGSGLVDIVGELVAHGVIDRNGRIAAGGNGSIPGVFKERLGLKDGKPVFFLSDSVYLSQGDVRQVQLAKGAIRTGVEYLLRDAGAGPGDVDAVLIAGAFGYHLKEKNLLALGLLPGEFRGKVSFVGNTSKTGGVAFLLNKGYRAEMEGVARAVRTIELADYEDFDRTFVNFLRF